MIRFTVVCFSALAGALVLIAADQPAPAAAPLTALTPDMVAKLDVPRGEFDHERRVVEIPMRDGVKLHTVILVPKGAQRAPIVLTRTPYDADGRANRTENSPRLQAVVNLADEMWATDGYIRVFQDVRGIHHSEGDYVMTRPARGPLNDSPVDHTTDAWDTIEWLVKHVPESNGRVGMIGSSYEGFTVVMALLDPHPALKVAAPLSPMIDGWMGDDWFHYGAFRQVNLDYFSQQLVDKASGEAGLRGDVEDYDFFLRTGSAGDFARRTGIDQIPWWKKLVAHPAYDGFWQGQALDRLLVDHPLKVPTLWLQGLFDQEDMWGAVHAYPVLEAKDTRNDGNFLVLGPWFHSQINRVGRELGPFKWDGDTTAHVRDEIIKPFFDQHLKDGAPAAALPPVYVYNTGRKRWDRFDRWPAGAVAQPATALYLQPGFGLGFAPAVSDAGQFDEYISDPAKPVPYQPRPIRFSNDAEWRTWLVRDQRFVSDRPDVLTYMSAPLTAPLHVAGSPLAHLVAATSGTDSDWVVKLIDVFPDEVPSEPEFAGYQFAVAIDIFRGRYRESFEHPAPLQSGAPLKYAFALPPVNHVFRPGHRVMVQIQSTLFPLYDRNPQKFVPNIFLAQPADYQKATQRIYRGAAGTRIELPVLEKK